MSDEQIANDAKYLIQFIKASLAVLSHRVMSIMAMLLGGGLAVYAAAVPDLYRTVATVAFWVLCFWPVLYMEFRVNAEK